jgi:hypothetical protein
MSILFCIKSAVNILRGVDRFKTAGIYVYLMLYALRNCTLSTQCTVLMFHVIITTPIFSLNTINRLVFIVEWGLFSVR